jgi:CBS domain-containing protein
MASDQPRKHVSHPIVRLEVLGPNGRRQTALRVFCRERRTAVPVGVCAACRRCEAIVASPAPAVSCLVTEARADLPYDPLGLRTPVAEVLTSETFAVEAETTLREALAHLHAEDRRSVAVVDGGKVVIGVVHERQSTEFPRDLPVTLVMGSKLALPMSTPIRRALELMAAAHLREVVVVDEEQVPLGTFRDVDGLHWLARARHR